MCSVFEIGNTANDIARLTVVTLSTPRRIYDEPGRGLEHLFHSLNPVTIIRTTGKIPVRAEFLDFITRQRNQLTPT